MRVIAIIMVLAAIAWGVEVARQALAEDDGGPPLGAICMAVPSIGLLIGAGIIWPSANRRKEERKGEERKGDIPD